MPRVLAALPALLLLAACGQPQGAQNAAYAADAKAAQPVASAITPAPAPVPAAADFVAKAAAGDAFELQAAAAAQGHADDAQVKAFAAMMARDHAKSAADLRQAVAQSGLSLTPAGGLSAGQQQGLADLGKAAGHDFDKGYMAGQVQAHQDALTLLQDYAQNGDNPSLKAFAGEALRVVQHHYALAKSLRDSLQ